MIPKIYRLVHSNDLILRQISETDSLMPLEWGKLIDIGSLAKEVEYSNLKSELKCKNKICYYYFNQGILLGFIIFSKILQNRVKINSLWIHPDFRMKGYGTRLKIYTEEWCKKRNIDFIQSNVDSANEKMISLNMKLGYSEKNTIMEKRVL